MNAHPDNPLLGPRDAFIVANQRLVHSIAQSYRYNAEYDDIVSEGTIGLILAYDRYNDASRQFSTYAVPYIRGYISNYFRSKSGVFSAPRNTVALARKILAMGLDEEPAGVISDLLSVPLKAVENALICIASRNADSADDPETIGIMPLTNDDTTHIDVDMFVNQLSHRQSEIVRLLMSGDTQVEVGDKLGITRQAVSQAVKKIAATYEKTAA